MRVFRLSREKYAYQLNGIGASKFGGRWNTKGTEIVYTAESRALAMAEVAVHLNLTWLPRDYMMVEVHIPDKIGIDTIKPGKLPDNWSEHPPNSRTQHLGDQFTNDKKDAVLKVPSAVVQGDFNYLIDPHHHSFKDISIIDAQPFPFDKRLIVKG